MHSRTPPTASNALVNCKGDKTTAGTFPVGRLTLFIAIAVGGLIADLWSKSYIFERLGFVLVNDGRNAPPIWLVHEILGFETSLNEGALFGLGQGFVTLFAVLSILAAFGVLYWLVFAGGLRDLVLTVALACVTAGIFGNLYDRLGMPNMTWADDYGTHQSGDPVYAVRDWIHFKIEIDAFHFDWPTFNIADSFLVIGVALLLLHGLWLYNPPPEKASDG